MSFDGLRHVYQDMFDESLVIKVERAGLRSPRDYLTEVFTQAKAAESRQVVDIQACFISECERTINGAEPVGKCWFYITVMKKYPETLEEKLKVSKKVIGFSEEAEQKIAMQLTMGLHAIHKAGVINPDLSPANVEIDTTTEPGDIMLRFSDLGFILKALDLASVNMNRSKVKLNQNFKSRRSHKGEQTSQADDWESLSYLLFSIVSDLPWADSKSQVDILKLKEQFVYRQQWRGRIPKLYDCYLTYLFSQLSAGEEVDTVQLIKILNFLDYCPFTFTFNFGINLERLNRSWEIRQLLPPMTDVTLNDDYREHSNKWIEC